MKSMLPVDEPKMLGNQWLPTRPARYYARPAIVGSILWFCADTWLSHGHFLDQRILVRVTLSLLLGAAPYVGIVVTGWLERRFFS